jgi:Cu-Zn family superoxide dismutase
MIMRQLLCGIAVLGAAAASLADEVTIDMKSVTPDGVGASIGSVTATDSPDGLRLTPNLHGLSPGAHGFHVHQNPDCGPGMKDDKAVAGLAAGGHFDPFGIGKHMGPEGYGHLGDLPVLEVADDGSATQSVVAPRLTVGNIRGRALMIHGGGDNYSDDPKPLGGGGARVACGVVE